VAYASMTSPADKMGASAGSRAVAGVVAALCLGLLVLASTLRADPAGHGTHRRLGLPACGFVMATGKPCITCGMTTSFAHAARASWWGALRAQPAGALLAVGVAATFWVALVTALTGSSLGVWAMRLVRPRTLWVVAGICLLAWAYKWLTWGAG
jgi:hypothetical protein